MTGAVRRIVLIVVSSSLAAVTLAGCSTGLDGMPLDYLKDGNATIEQMEFSEAHTAEGTQIVGKVPMPVTHNYPDTWSVWLRSEGSDRAYPVSIPQDYYVQLKSGDQVCLKNREIISYLPCEG